MPNLSVGAAMNAIRILLLLLPCNAALAACPTNMNGSSKEFDVTVYQDCGIRPEIVVKKKQHARNKAGAAAEYQRAFFDTECKFSNDESSLSCHQSGKTVLSGTTYKMTHDGPPDCEGATEPSFRYTCIRGCNKSAPKHLNIDPYECDIP